MLNWPNHGIVMPFTQKDHGKVAGRHPEHLAKARLRGIAGGEDKRGRTQGHERIGLLTQYGQSSAGILHNAGTQWDAKQCEAICCQLWVGACRGAL